MADHRTHLRLDYLTAGQSVGWLRRTVRCRSLYAWGPVNVSGEHYWLNQDCTGTKSAGLSVEER